MQASAKLESALDSMTRVSDLVSRSIRDVQDTFKEVHFHKSADNIFEIVDNICSDKITIFSRDLGEIGLDGDLEKVYLNVFKDKVNEAGDYLVSKVGSKLTVVKYNEYLYISKALGGNLCLSYAMSIGEHGLTSSEKERLLRAAADGGHPEACNEISIWYEVGRHLKEDEKLAEHYSNQAYNLFNEQAELYNEARSRIKSISNNKENDICKIILSWIEAAKTKENEIIMSRISTNIFIEVLTAASHQVNGYDIILEEALSLQDNSNSVHYDSVVHEVLRDMGAIITKQRNMYFRGLDSSEEYIKNDKKIEELKQKLNRR
jgi:hypothetical protein